jgi:hypothetical protein
VGGTITGTYTANDAGSGVDTVTLFVRAPGAAWASAGAVTGGTFSYTPTAGSGVYQFATVAADATGNAGVAPSGNAAGDITVSWNSAANAPYALDITAPGTYVYPMTATLDIVLTVTDVVTTATVTVSRTIGDTAPAGFVAGRLIDEQLLITGGFLGQATITWNFDAASASGLEGTFDTAYRLLGGVYQGQFPVTPVGNTIVIGPVTAFSEWWAGSGSASANDWMLLVD